MELEEDNVEEEGGGAGVSLADVTESSCRRLIPVQMGIVETAAAPAATCCRCP
jgi:hypothetical protein